MPDILSAILYDEPMDLQGKGTFVPPCTVAEQQVLPHLKTLDAQTADALKQYIYALVQEQYAEAFLTGTRFGSQLMLQLTAGY